MSRAYSSTPIPELTDAELREILLTCDGRGKEVKAEALDLLILHAKMRQSIFESDLRDELR